MPVRPCPSCGVETPRKLDAVSDHAHVNYYRCPACGHVWTTTKDGAVILSHVTVAPSGDPKPVKGLKRRRFAALRGQAAKARHQIQEARDRLRQAMHRAAEVIGHTQNIARGVAGSSGRGRFNIRGLKDTMTDGCEAAVHKGSSNDSPGQRNR